MRDYDLSPYASPRANSPEPLFPLAAISAASVAAAAAVAVARQQAPYEVLQPISEAASGSVTPAAFSGDDASPRAVLRGASDVLFSQQTAAAQAVERGAGALDAPAGSAKQEAGSGGAAQAPPALVRKSLLSSSLAATGRRASSPEHQRPPGSCDEPGRAVRAVSEPLPPLPPTSPAAVLHRAGPGGLSYRIASEWQQPAIRTVKMQGAPARQQPK